MKKLLNALKEINWNFGRGKIVRVILNPDGISGTVVRRIPITQCNGFEETRTFRMTDRKVKFLGSSRTLA